VDFSVIKNGKLKVLLENSLSFRNLRPLDQERYIEIANAVPQEKQEAMCEFFINELSSSPESIENVVEKIEQIGEELMLISKAFKKTVLVGQEKKSHEEDEAKIHQLFSQIN